MGAACKFKHTGFPKRSWWNSHVTKQLIIKEIWMVLQSWITGRCIWRENCKTRRAQMRTQKQVRGSEAASRHPACAHLSWALSHFPSCRRAPNQNTSTHATQGSDTQQMLLLEGGISKAQPLPRAAVKRGTSTVTVSASVRGRRGWRERRFSKTNLKTLLTKHHR